MSGELQSCKRNIDKEPFLHSQIFYAVLCTFCRTLIRTWKYLGIVQWNDVSERYRCGIEKKI